ncbi:MAG: hypothetical protein WBQ60_11120, partial [Asticcacaulis sp.]
MRKLAVAFVLALMTWTTANAAPSAFQQDVVDITFVDIFESLVTKVDINADQAFFETEVLKGLAKKSVVANNISSAQDYEYTYGPESGAKGSRYVEWHSDEGKFLQFSATDFSDNYQKVCLTFNQAESDLRKQGWSRHPDDDDLLA